MKMKALIFDCDGVLVDTEKDGHRAAFNEAFAKSGLNISWDVKTYGDLLKIAGGKERMHFYFEQAGWPENVTDKQKFIAELHQKKTNFFIQRIKTNTLPYRPGILRIIEEAIQQKMLLAVCSTSDKKAVEMIVSRLGETRSKHFAEVLAGDVVTHKKPSPEIYLLASEKLKVTPDQCLVIEDSEIGLRAAKSAGMQCVITKSTYTRSEDFSLADLVLDELGDAPRKVLSLSEIIHRVSDEENRAL